MHITTSGANRSMSALGQKQTLGWRPLMSALRPKADMDQQAGENGPPPPSAAKRYALRLLSKKSSFLSECRAVVIDLLSIDDDELELITGDRTLA
ncbi:MAG TPA: hypothetical protein VER26_11290 [Xanthobacteraceae bacterium]|jgi:hypothetical protein|nr:hypothetical protein [Xanthobacteraceae bacterium]